MSGNYIGGRIRELRKQHNITVPELANMVGVATSHISNVESDPDRSLSLPVAAAIADVFGVSIDHLFGRDDDESGTGDIIYSITIQGPHGPLQVFSRRPLRQAFVDAVEDAADLLGG